MWQDYVIAGVQLFLVGSLLPSIFHTDNKPTLLTSTATGILLVIMAITFATLSLWFAVTTSVMAAISWFILAFQRYRINVRTGLSPFGNLRTHSKDAARTP